VLSDDVLEFSNMIVSKQVLSASDEGIEAAYHSACMESKSRRKVLNWILQQGAFIK
jgi:hypothetical protein